MRGVTKRNLPMKTQTKRIAAKPSIGYKAIPAPLMPAKSIKVDAKQWHAWNALNTRLNALKQESDAMREAMRLDSDSIKTKFGQREQVIIIKDKNGLPLGKANVFFKDGWDMPSTWQVRVS